MRGAISVNCSTITSFTSSPSSPLIDRRVGGATYDTSNTIFVDNDRPPLLAVITYVFLAVRSEGVPVMDPSVNFRPGGNSGSEVKTGLFKITPTKTGELGGIFTF